MAEIKNKSSKKHITRINRAKSAKAEGVDTLKYCRKIKLVEAPLEIQKKLRNEWQ